MRETSIYSAIYTGIRELNFCGTDFNPNISSLAWELLISKRYGGTIILPSSNKDGFEIVKNSSSVADIKDDGVTVDDLWDCTKEHYGLTAITGVIGAAIIPIKKMFSMFSLFLLISPVFASNPYNEVNDRAFM